MCSRKCGNFFRAKAVCKFHNCLIFYFIIKNYPILSNANATIEVEYKVSGTLSAEHTDGRTVHSIHLLYSRRLHVATELTEKYISNYFYNQFPASDSPNNELDYGNFNKIKSSATLRKAKFDLSSLQRYSNENWSEISRLQEYYRNIIIGNQIRGYIQSLSHDPFIIHMYTEEQINVLKLFKNTSVVQHLDATGSIVRKIDISQKKVFYYALTVRHPEFSTSPIPLSEMISASHSAAEITYFLHKWSLRRCKESVRR